MSSAWHVLKAACDAPLVEIRISSCVTLVDLIFELFYLMIPDVKFTKSHLVLKNKR